ncbi:MAG: type II toxin-antitoxin system Phd/YefM family antitoxin [Oscillospiraceae bacterium]|nr:type II toxin-antitoxin system Phd/YefM family antitoxin [Oscillospiraceae bacterium]
MPTIKSSTDLRNHYNEISTLCHETNEPVYITKNGKGDLVIMSMETYDELFGKFELYKLIQDGIDDVNEDRSSAADEAMKRLLDKYKIEDNRA